MRAHGVGAARLGLRRLHAQSGPGVGSAAADLDTSDRAVASESVLARATAMRHREQTPSRKARDLNVPGPEGRSLRLNLNSSLNCRAAVAGEGGQLGRAWRAGRHHGGGDRPVSPPWSESRSESESATRSSVPMTR